MVVTDPNSPEASPVQAKATTELYEGIELNSEEDHEPIAMASPRSIIAVSNVSNQPLVEETETVVRPLAFYHPRLESNWTDDQLQTLDNLRNEFVAALGGWNQNPSDPRYRELWMEAQPIIDEQFEVIFGVEGFSDQQIHAVHQKE
jgi:hypothetical protein